VSRIAIYWTAFALVVGVAYGGATMMRHLRRSPAIVHVDRPVELPAGPPLESFELTDSSGQPFSSTSLRGKVWLGSFFFTNCPSACRKLNQAIASVQQKYPEMQFVSITCDPTNDTPEKLAEYAKLFDADPARWHFLTGKIDYILRIGTDLFKVTVVPGDHSTRAVLVGRDGKIVGHYQMTEAGDLEKLAEAIPKALAASAPAPLSSESGTEPPDQPAPEPAAASGSETR
jgi:cytochrome oxidase Cu insertion factor (SCO1/SenC/PrrC family)